MSGVPLAALDRYRQERTDEPEDRIDAIRAPDRELVPGVEVETDIGTWQRTRRPATRPPTSACISPSAACCSPATTCSAAPSSSRLRALPRPVRGIPSQASTGSNRWSRPLPARPRQTVPRPGDPHRRRPHPDRACSSTAPAPPSPKAGGADRLRAGRSDRRSGEPRTPGTGGFMLQIVLACLDHLAARGEISPVPDSDPQRWGAEARRLFPSPRPPAQAVARASALARCSIALVVLAVAAVVVGYEVLKRPGDVHNETAINHFKPEKPKEAPKPVRGVFAHRFAPGTRSATRSRNPGHGLGSRGAGHPLHQRDLPPSACTGGARSTRTSSTIAPSWMTRRRGSGKTLKQLPSCAGLTSLCTSGSRAWRPWPRNRPPGRWSRGPSTWAASASP